MGLTVFVLACFVGYYVVWNVTPALHSPADGRHQRDFLGDRRGCACWPVPGSASSGFSKGLGFLAVIWRAVNIFGGFLVTQRMLSMFKS